MITLKNRKILVTGGTGFIGSALVRRLVAAGARVRSFDNDSRGVASRLDSIAHQVEMVTGDIRDPAAVATAIRGVDTVCHLAYINGTQFFYTKPELILEVGVKGMMNVLDGCIAHGVRDLVLASSSEVYQTAPIVPTDESVPLVVPDVQNPRYSYGGGKIISELLTINYGRKHFDRAVIFRPHNVYGPDMGWEHVIPQLAIKLHDLSQPGVSTVRLPIQGNGQETRAFLHIDDATAGIARIIERGEHLGVYHLGTDQETTIAELAHQIGSAQGKHVTLVPGALQPGGTLRRCPNIAKLRALGFEPTVSLEEGLQATVAWYCQHADRRPKSEKEPAHGRHAA